MHNHQERPIVVPASQCIYHTSTFLSISIDVQVAFILASDP